MALTESRKRANQKYNAKAYEQIQLRVRSGQKAVIQESAQIAGMSVNSFILEAIQEKMERQLLNEDNRKVEQNTDE